MPVRGNYTACPECRSMNTRITDRDNYWNEKIAITRRCTDCPTTFTVEYSDPSIEHIETARSNFHD